MNLNKVDVLRKTDCGKRTVSFAGLIAAAIMVSVLAGCGGGGGGGGSSTGTTGTTGNTGPTSITLQGTVTEAGVTPTVNMPNMTVIVENSSPVISTTTDASGNYTLTGLKPNSSVTLDVDYTPPGSTADYKDPVSVGATSPQTVNIGFTSTTPPPPPPP